jgi:hypothetical protein
MHKYKTGTHNEGVSGTSLAFKVLLAGNQDLDLIVYAMNSTGASALPRLPLQSDGKQLYTIFAYELSSWFV